MVRTITSSLSDLIYIKIKTSKKKKKLLSHEEYVIEKEHQNDRENMLMRRMRIPYFLRFRHYALVFEGSDNK